MKKYFSRFLVTVVGALLLTATAFAAGADGTWTGTLATPNGDFQQIFKLKTDGAKLTGTMVGPDGTDIAITDGKVDGNNVSFTVNLDFGGNSIQLNYKGVVSEDQIALTIDAMGNTMEVTVKKSAS
jgi:hypothetical protein